MPFVTDVNTVKKQVPGFSPAQIVKKLAYVYREQRDIKKR
jgi:hypothetical protein